MKDPLFIDARAETKRISNFIRKTVKQAGALGVVLALSGGVDSAVVGALCVKALGKEKVLAVMLPSRFTPAQDMEDAEALASSWGVVTRRADITPVVDSVLFGMNIDSDRVAKGNVQARIRMTMVYYLSNSGKLLVAGTGDRSEGLTGFYCFDSKTRAVTPNGLKSLPDLQVGDLVFSMDPITKKLVEARISGLNAFPYSGNMIHFQGRGTDLLVTPNHRMIVHTSSSKEDSRLVVRSALECLAFKNTITPNPVGWAGDAGLPMEIQLTFSQRHVERNVRLGIEEALYLLGLFVGDGCAVIDTVVMPVKSSLGRREYSTSHRGRDGRFTTITLAEVKPVMKEYPEYTTVFALPDYTKHEARGRLIGILQRRGIGYHLTRNTVVINSRGVYEFFVQCGVGARNKRIPQWAMRYPPQILTWLYKGLKDSDGAHPETTHMYYTASEGLKDDVVQLCFKLGRRASVAFNPAKRPRINGKTIKTGPSFTIIIAKKHRSQHAIYNRRAAIEDYEGIVWCPTIPKYENLLVERNGKYAISGNSKFGDGGVDFLPIAHLYKTQVRALAKHLGIPEGVATKPSSPALWAGHTAADELPEDYDRLDPLLYYIFERKLTPLQAAKKVGVDPNVAKEVMEMHRGSAHKRALPPSLL